MGIGVNRVTLVGNVGNEPEATETGPARMSLATSHRYKRGEEWKEETEWHRLVFFGRLKDIVLEHVHKGARLYCEGRLHYSSWKDEHDQTRYSTEIIVDQLVMLGDSAGKREPKPEEQPRQQAVARPGSPPARQAARPAAKAAVSVKQPFDDDDDLPF